MVEIFQNIRKIYTFREPCPELADHVEFFSESSVDATRKHIGNENFSVKMFPSWTPTFYINLGAPYHISVGGKPYFVPADEDILILRNSIVERYNHPADNIFTVKFYPGGLEAVLNIKQPMLADKLIRLSEILPTALLKKVKQPISFTGRVELVEQFLLKSYRSKEDHYLKLIKDTIDTFADGGLLLKNDQLAEKMFTTSKTLNRYFNQVIGISPKNYLSLVRTRTALTAYVNQKEIFTPYDFGYYDMSHFYKDVVKFTGQKLTANAI
ncbi:MAG TPA: helix-turn-helix domain-containing protein [Mucilaginibacter sp.]